MPYIGNNHIAGDHTNNFKVLDDISSYTATFDGSAASVIDTTNNTIRVVEHRFIQGQRVTYTNGGGGNIGGLTTGTVYFVIFDSASTIKLATNASNAASSTAINLSAVGTGSSHTLNAAFDGINTKFKITYNGGTGARFNNATQLNIAINNVLQKPNVDSITFTEGFAIEDNHKIVFKTAPTEFDIFWGSIIANTLTTFDISDHKIDTFTGDGSTTEFTLSHTPANNESLMVTINGVLQHPSNASTARAYTLIASIIQFTAAPGVGDEIQVRHLGFAGATTADVSGFYGRTGNVALTANDHITVGDIPTVRNINASGIITASQFVGNLNPNVGGSNANFTGIVTAGVFKGGDIEGRNLKITGLSTFVGDASFTGNVSIGGTLTYEDVTNIDSVGIITARSDIHVGAGISAVGVITGRYLNPSSVSTQNVIIGWEQSTRNVTGNWNVLIGRRAGEGLTSASSAVCIGANAGQLLGGTSGIFIGGQAGSKVTGAGNLFIGGNAGQQTTSASACTIIGHLAGIDNQGSNNTILGYYAGRGNSGVTDGAQNTFLGTQSGFKIQGGDDNTGVGYYTLRELLGGNKNVAIGKQAGDALVSGNNNIIIGHQADASTSTTSNEITLGDANINHLRIPGIGVSFNNTGGTQLGVVTATTFVGNGDFVELDVDGHTNLDNVSIVGVVTVSSNVNTSRIIAENSSSSVPTAKFTNLGTGRQLEIYGSATSTILIKATNNNGTPKLQLRDNYNRDNFISVTDSGDNLVLAADEGNQGSDSTMQFRVDGGEKLRITSAGSVGINQDNPQALVSLGAGVNAQKLLMYDNTDNNKYGFGIQPNEFRQFYPSDSRMVIGTIATSDGSTFSEKLRIASTGNVSIGTQNVTEGVLQVNGDITAKLQHGSSDMYGMLAGRKFDGSNAMGGYAIRYGSGYESPWIVGYNAGSSYDNQITFGSMTTSDRSLATGVQKRMVIDMASGKVGIGENSPDSLLHIKGNDTAYSGNVSVGPVLNLEDSQGRVAQFIGPGSVGDASIGTKTNHHFSIMTGNSSRIFINNNDGSTSFYGDVTSVDTTSGSTVTRTLKVGASAASGTNNGTIIINNGGLGNASLQFDYENSAARAKIYTYRSTNDIIFDTSGAEKFRILNSGQLRGRGTYNGSSSTSNDFPCLNISNLQGSYTANNIIGGITFGKVAGHTNGIRAGILALYQSIGNQNGNIGTNLIFRTASESAGDSTEKLRITSDGRLFVNTTAVVNSDDFLTIKRPASSNSVTSMTLDASNSTSNYANALFFTKSKDYYYNGIIFTSSSGHQGGICGKMSVAGGTSPQIDFRVGGSGFNSSDTLAMIIHGSGNITINENLAVGGSYPWSVTGGNYGNLSISGGDASSSGFLWLGNGAATNNADFDLGRINFMNGGTIVARVIGTTDTSANDDGVLRFNTKKTGETEAERLRIDSNGVIAHGPFASFAYSNLTGFFNVHNGARVNTGGAQQYAAPKGGFVDNARYELEASLISYSTSAQQTIQARNGAQLKISDSRNNWSHYNNLPNYLLGHAATDCINTSNYTLTLKATMTVFLQRSNGWNAVPLSGWNLLESDTNIYPGSSSSRLYVKTLAAGSYSGWDSDSAMYFFVL